ncbi:iron complex transport system ATP-binding protein [Desulfonatronum thiosulfatophilum]|uniref:Iron complex transport system ATP-binding protein n=1 Tax=Desulfonatronum thiosulfatophilum TaxID=617002 RepID=A0A1G6E014_9BACT|nr:ABC transporter ATP-binding protein [Desulfonatronum thiosulfatophilum]SDB50355.1 iron complex transport system ATP-binding protein [Desulfonatronum thiosulfatophilum]
MILDVQNIRIGYNGRLVLQGLDFVVNRGQVLTILGPNGVGKTTLLRCINAMLKPKSGAVLVENADVFRMRAGDIAKRLGYVAQRNEAGRMTAFDAVLLGRKPHLRWKVTESDLRKVDGALKQLGLEHLALRHINEMSGGELQKVCIARALVQEPSVLLLDEPTSSLDLKNQLEILRTISHVVHEHQLAAVMTMHDLNMAFRFSDAFVFIKEGKVFCCGKNEELTPDMIREVYGVPVDILRHQGQTVVVPCV